MNDTSIFSCFVYFFSLPEKLGRIPQKLAISHPRNGRAGTLTLASCTDLRHCLCCIHAAKNIYLDIFIFVDDFVITKSTLNLLRFVGKLLSALLDSDLQRGSLHTGACGKT